MTVDPTLRKSSLNRYLRWVAMNVIFEREGFPVQVDLLWGAWNSAANPQSFSPPIFVDFLKAQQSGIDWDLWLALYCSPEEKPPTGWLICLVAPSRGQLEQEEVDLVAYLLWQITKVSRAPRN